MQPRRTGAGPVAVRVGPVGSEWAGWKPEVSEQAVTVAPGDGGHLLALDEPALWCPRHHGYKILKKRKTAGCSWSINLRKCTATFVNDFDYNEK